MSLTIEDLHKGYTDDMTLKANSKYRVSFQDLIRHMSEFYLPATWFNYPKQEIVPINEYIDLLSFDELSENWINLFIDLPGLDGFRRDGLEIEEDKTPVKRIYKNISCAKIPLRQITRNRMTQYVIGEAITCDKKDSFYNMNCRLISTSWIDLFYILEHPKETGFDEPFYMIVPKHQYLPKSEYSTNIPATDFDILTIYDGEMKFLNGTKLKDLRSDIDWCVYTPYTLFKGK